MGINNLFDIDNRISDLHECIENLQVLKEFGHASIHNDDLQYQSELVKKTEIMIDSITKNLEILCTLATENFEN